MEEEERCDFDLCFSCAEKEDIENVCRRGHQLHSVQLSGDSIYHWMCDVCGYQCSSEEKLDLVEVLRCLKDKRNPNHEVAQPSRFKWLKRFKPLKLLKWFQKKKASFSPQIMSVNDEFDQGSQSGEGGQSGGATGSQA